MNRHSPTRLAGLYFAVAGQLPHCTLFVLNCSSFLPLKKNPKLLPDDMVHDDQPDEQKQRSRKDRKGKKNKNKRDKGSKGKGKRKGKGKGKKGSRRRKHEEDDLEDGFLRVSTPLPSYLSQEPFLPTELPEIQKGLKTTIPPEDLRKSFTVMPTRELAEVLESKVTEEVDKLTCRPSPPSSAPAVCSPSRLFLLTIESTSPFASHCHH